MATKKSYKIPVGLDRSVLDHEIGLSGGGFTLPPTPLKVIVFYALSAIVLFWALTSTMLKSASIAWLVLFSILWVAMTLFLGKYGKNKEMALRKVPAFMEYLPRGNRKVMTRRTSNPSGFYGIAQIRSIDEDGFIEWHDGSVGQAYLVVGSASILVFEEDQKAIINRVDAFWRKVDTNSEWIEVTTKEPQRVYLQLANLDRTNKRLEDRDPELVELLQERYDILKDHVGGAFSSIHQYIVIKSDNLEALHRSHGMLSAEAEESGLMIKQAAMLDREDTIAMMRMVYAGSEAA